MQVAPEFRVPWCTEPLDRRQKMTIMILLQSLGYSVFVDTWNMKQHDEFPRLGRSSEMEYKRISGVRTELKTHSRVQYTYNETLDILKRQKETNEWADKNMENRAFDEDSEDGTYDIT